MSRLSFRILLCLSLLLMVVFSAGQRAAAQEFAGIVKTVPATDALPLISVGSRVVNAQDDVAHSVAIHSRAISMGAAKDMGRVPASANLRMGMVLELQRPMAQQKLLSAFIAETGRPDSPLYGKTLTPGEFAQRFGLAGSDLEAVTRWLDSKGFAVGNVDNGRLAIDFKGTAVQVEEAFHTEIHLYGTRGGNATDGTHFANATELQVPRQLARVIETIEGTQNFVPMQRPNFDGPVTDLPLGTELDHRIAAETGASPLPERLSGDTPHDASLTASRVEFDPEQGATTLNVRVGGDGTLPAGSLTLLWEKPATGERGTIAVVRDLTVCEGYNAGNGRSCTLDFRPASAGIYTLRAVYSGDENLAAFEQRLTIIANAASGVVTQVATISPINYYCPGYSSKNSTYCSTAAASGTISYNLSWAGSLGQPTGSVVFSLKSTFNPGTLVLPAAGSTTSSGSCAANNGQTGSSLVTFGTCSYSCTYTATQQQINCSLTDTAMNQVVQAGTAGLGVSAAFNDTDGNYANLAANSLTTAYLAIDVATLTASVTASPTLTASTYGQTTTENSFTITFTPSSGTVVNYEGSNSGPFFELTGGNQLGSLIDNSDLIAACTTACLAPETSAGNAKTWTVPAVVTPGTYPLTLTFSGTGAATSSSYTSWYKQVVSGSTINLLINQAQPTISLATPTAASPVSQTYGTTTPFNVTATLGWPGVGAAPTASALTFSTTATGGSFGTTTCGTPTLVSGTGNSSVYSATCTASYTPSGTANVGSYNFSASYSGDLNYLSAAASTITGDYKITQATSALGLTAATPGSTTTGTTSSLLTATLSPALSGVTVTFANATNAATVTATTNSSGVATYTASTSAFVVAGLNSVSASIAGTTNYTSATSTSSNLYIQGLLFSSTGKHNFSGVITNYPGYANVEGTQDGTKLGPYGVTVENFTTASQALTLTLNQANSPSSAFNSTTSCGASLAAGASCVYNFFYAPPAGDGCTPGTSCTTDGAGYPQGTYESATWNVTSASGALQGIGNSNFTRSGPVTLPSTLAGKAILAVPTLTVSPTSYTFASQAPNVTSNTLTVVVSNPNGVAVPFTYAGPSGASASNFTVIQNTCTSPLAGSSSCNIYVTFSASTPATYATTLVITPSGNAAITVNLGGTVESNSGLSLSSAGHSFGNVTDGTAATYGFTITNNSGASATLGVSYSAATAYTISNGCGTSLNAGASCSVNISFAPTTVATLNDSITLTSSVYILPGGTTSAPYSDVVSLTGAGVAGGQFTATSVGHNFGGVPVGDSAGNYGVEFSNNSSAAVTLSLGSGFVQGTNGFTVVGTSCGSSLAVNANCELIFSFTPTATGAVSAVYPINASATLYSGGNAINPSQISLSGTGQ